MSPSSNSLAKQEWIKASLDNLHRKGSWCGRLHVHKLLVITELLDVADVPFNFTLYQYGPYSFDLDSCIAELEAFGEIECTYRQPGYGPSYSIIGHAARLDKDSLDGLARVSDEIGGASGKELELVSTCLWVMVKEKIADNESIVSRVHTLKPKFEVLQIHDALNRARNLQKAIAR